MAVRVLVVEDSPRLQRVLGAMYGVLGCDVTLCSTQQEAERLLAGDVWGIVHLDDNLTPLILGQPRPHEGSRVLAPIALQRGFKVIGCSDSLQEESGKPLWPKGVIPFIKPPVSREFERVVHGLMINLPG